MEPTGLRLNPDPAASLYLLCDHRQATSPLRVSVASLASKDGDSALRVVLGTGVDIFQVLNTCLSSFQ